jgi:MFS superfamily sulfate permease-like transporter
MSVGYAEVTAKRREWAALGHKARRAILEHQVFPAVRGPGGRYYIIDHHHLALALIEEEVAAVWVAALGLLLPWVQRMPEPVLAAIVIFAMRHALTLEPLRPYLKWKRDRALVAVAIAAVLLLGVLDGLLIAIGVSLALLIREFTQPRVSVLGRLAGSHDFVSLGFHPDVQLVPQLLILRPEEPLFFANAEAVLEEAAARVAAAPAARALVLSLEESPNLDGTAIEALGEFASGLLRQGLNLRLARLKDPVFAVLTTAALPGLTGAALSGASVDAVVRGLTGPSA